MPVFENSGDLRTIVGPDFALIFERADDRWTHSIAVSASPGAPRETIARAIEWAHDRDDPTRVVSPVFQELHFQNHSDGTPQALLVGMSGRHHFSAVFSLVERAEGSTLSVDVADRAPSDVVALASTYAVMLHSGDLEGCDESMICWSISDRRLRFQAVASARVGLAEAGRRATRVQVGIDANSSTPTRRWQYSWDFSRPV